MFFFNLIIITRFKKCDIKTFSRILTVDSNIQQKKLSKLFLELACQKIRYLPKQD